MSYLIALLLVLPLAVYCQVPNLDAITADAFRKSDIDGDGNIERPEVDQYFQKYDTNHDNRITQHEYSLQVNSTYAHDPQVTHILHSLFDGLDFNNDRHLDTADYDHFFTITDSNNNQLLSFDEFSKVFKGALQAAIAGN
ncbi:uncharacterized protein LOC131947705 [Physella acuta]|uniref:uncharacterized protein LOC131947705 n=1 Tax=Physella acuta TaxID=109671 RepID=UPI0027DB5534|nr:uncharacterized protein LOC131947705 [Physella acuta]